MDFKNSQPIDDGEGLWQLQNELMAEAESLFGKRDPNKIIYQPSWDTDGPHVRYTPNKDGAFAELGPVAEKDWRYALYHLAHETVHLLDQQGGERTHLLEEGAAVRFSLDMMEKYGFDTAGFPALQTYKSALQSFEGLGADPYSVAKDCRATCGDFISIDEATLKSKCSHLDDDEISKLLSKPEMR